MAMLMHHATINCNADAITLLHFRGQEIDDDLLYETIGALNTQDQIVVYANLCARMHNYGDLPFHLLSNIALHNMAKELFFFLHYVNDRDEHTCEQIIMACIYSSRPVEMLEVVLEFGMMPNPIAKDRGYFVCGCPKVDEHGNADEHFEDHHTIGECESQHHLIFITDLDRHYATRYNVLPFHQAICRQHLISCVEMYNVDALFLLAKHVALASVLTDCRLAVAIHKMYYKLKQRRDDRRLLLLDHPGVEHFDAVGAVIDYFIALERRIISDSKVRSKPLVRILSFMKDIHRDYMRDHSQHEWFDFVGRYMPRIHNQFCTCGRPDQDVACLSHLLHDEQKHLVKLFTLLGQQRIQT